MTEVALSRSAKVAPSKGFAALGLAALGIVFGDIGTSPLYTMKVVLTAAGANPTSDAVLGSLSLIFWTLTLVTTIKYVTVAMRIDNDGEGGILALMSLLGVKRHARPVIVSAGLFGAALIYGDGAITPAISVLSALEGLETATPAFKPYILHLALAVLAALFFIQPLGTQRIGRTFGPIMLVWFLAIGLLGVIGIAQNPTVLEAVNPLFALRYLLGHGLTGFLVLGSVFLCVTGAEALYADMGHFGARPIRRVWSWVVFPSLVLSYAGQAAYVLEHGATADNIFYRLCPDWLLVPMVLLATAATIIASQSIITGAFSMTRQAIQLGWMPRLQIKQTSADGYGQIYVGAVNWLLMLITIGLTVAFRKSDNLASAYGIAVSMTMLMTTILIYLAMREVWHWGVVRATLIAGLFFVVDAAFFAANSVKIADGGYVPLVLGLLIYGVMFVWHRGSDEIRERLRETIVPIDTFMARQASAGLARVPGTAVFLTRSVTGTPPVVAWYVDHVHALQKRVVAITVETLTKPWADRSEHISLVEAAPDFWRVQARYGFMERPDIQRLLVDLSTHGCGVDVEKATFYFGTEAVVPRAEGGGLPRWFVGLFSLLVRAATPVSDLFNLPRDRVVQLGRRVAI